jgi:hypothetical protein
MQQMKDPLTGVVFTPARSNQKYLNSVNRIRFNNEKAKKIRQAKSKVDIPLRINYKVLSDILQEDKEKIVHKEFLLGKGFDFRYTTNHVQNNGKSSPVYYDYVLSTVEGIPDHLKIQKL